ncbi:hypothetical protein H6P81_015611 [Aristolochia fimbriata]|uniref:Alginate lyase 2 domain-containing protein n=1 Tax=Aristolochia fimbriata TaxID=158543 RepID=A0AAV7E8Y6_ARIFI|nr:hypothetical protein H6P81_015611 [Aristolochia fimbriata]
MPSSSSLFVLVIFLLFSTLPNLRNVAVGWHPVDPLSGFVELPLNESNFDIQRPYDVPLHERYSIINGVHKLWVFSSDKPHALTSNTNPRTEIRIRGYDYSTGVWQFEGHGYVPSGTSGVCIMQVFGANRTATTLMLRVYEGAVTYYRSGPVLVPRIYDKWFRLNVIHDVGAGKVKVFVDGVLKLEVKDRGGASHYFKCGVYAQNDDSSCMESRWKGIKGLTVDCIETRFRPSRVAVEMSRLSTEADDTADASSRLKHDNLTNN